MTLRLAGSSSGYTEIDAPAVAGSNTLVLPTGNGSAGNILGTDGAGNLSWVNGRMVLETAKATTSGTAIDFTGIPSWVKRVTVMLDAVSTNGTSIVQVQLGSGTVNTSGYVGAGGSYNQANATGATANTSGFLIGNFALAANTICGALTICRAGANLWVCSGTFALASSTNILHSAGAKALSGDLDRVRITTVNGTDTFDAGSINILYEG
jgi:hypothetical protein